MFRESLVSLVYMRSGPMFSSDSYNSQVEIPLIEIVCVCSTLVSTLPRGRYPS